MYIPRKHAPSVRSTHATMTTKGRKRDILPLALVDAVRFFSVVCCEDSRPPASNPSI